MKMQPTSNDTHLPVSFNQELRPGQNRYRLECGWYFDCGCYHGIGSHTYCVKHLRLERVTASAVSVYSTEDCAWNVTYANETDH